MSLLKRLLKGDKARMQPANVDTIGNIRFESVTAMERSLDGSDETFHAYYFAVYHCSPSESAGTNQYREQLKQTYPDKVAQVGRYFVLWGTPAFLALSSYYKALIEAETLSDEFRAYIGRRLEEAQIRHNKSQGLPIPVNLSEGQLADDPQLEFLTCIALRNGQVRLSQG